MSTLHWAMNLLLAARDQEPILPNLDRLLVKYSQSSSLQLVLTKSPSNQLR